MQIIRAQIQSIVAESNSRVLLCADFGYGYPAGFASLHAKSVPGKLPPWRIVWQYLGKHVHDDLGTKPGEQPTNRNNRFEVASAINSALSNPDCPVHSGVSSRRVFTPTFHRNGRRNHSSARAELSLRFVSRTGERRAIRRSAFSDRQRRRPSAYRDPRLERMRFDPEFAECSAVWPFETGWAPASGSWLDPQLRVLHAEIYPSVRERLSDPIKDRGQVRAMWHWARDLDAKNILIREFATPPGIVNASEEDNVICSEEGWILGCPH